MYACLGSMNVLYGVSMTNPKLSSFLLPSQMIDADCTFNTLLNRQQIVFNRVALA